MLPMVVTQLQCCVLTLPSCYNAKMVVETAEVVAGPRLAVGVDQLWCRLPVLRHSRQLQRKTVVLQNSLE